MQRLSFIPICLIATLAGLLSVSCSVKEPRWNCPTIVTLDLDKFEALKESDNAKVTVYSGRKSNRTEDVYLPECVGIGHKVLVEKTLNTFCCAVGYEGMETRADSIYCLPGRQWCPLWRDGFSEECTEDVYHFAMTPHKEYCTVYLEIAGLDPGKDYPYDIHISAYYNGVRLHDAQPIAGRFSAFASRPDLTTNVMTVTVPRQLGYGMTLELMERKNDNPERAYDPEDVMKTYDLGKVMQASGYSWGLADLEDFHMTVDFSQAKLIVGLQEWDESELSDKI